jgi:hypothetical protein
VVKLTHDVGKRLRPPWAFALPLNSQDFGTSRWQLIIELYTFPGPPKGHAMPAYGPLRRRPSVRFRRVADDVATSHLTAAYLDYRDTGELARGVGRGEAPPPTGYHGTGRAREPVWSKAAIDSFATPPGIINSDGTNEQDLASLV